MRPSNVAARSCRTRVARLSTFGTIRYVAPPGFEQPPDLAQERPRLVDVLEHGEDRDDVVLAVELLDRRVDRVDAELVARVRERAAPELRAEPAPPALCGLVQEEADRRAHVEQRAPAAVRLQLVEDLGELLRGRARAAVAT